MTGNLDFDLVQFSTILDGPESVNDSVCSSREIPMTLGMMSDQRSLSWIIASTKHPNTALAELSGMESMESSANG